MSQKRTFEGRRVRAVAPCSEEGRLGMVHALSRDVSWDTKEAASPRDLERKPQGLEKNFTGGRR